MSTFKLETAKAACDLMPDVAMKEVALGVVDRFQKSVDEMFSNDFAKHPASTTAADSSVSAFDLEKTLQIMRRYARPPADQVVRYEVSFAVWDKLKEVSDQDFGGHGQMSTLNKTFAGIPIVKKPGLAPGFWKEIFADGREVWHLGPYQMSMPARPRPQEVANV